MLMMTSEQSKRRQNGTFRCMEIQRRKWNQISYSFNFHFAFKSFRFLLLLAQMLKAFNYSRPKIKA